jgi:hypothetical protein
MTVWPIVTYGSESWPLKRKDEHMLQIFERMIRVLGIYGPIKDNGKRKARYNHELYKLQNEPDIVKVVKVGRLRSDTFLE